LWHDFEVEGDVLHLLQRDGLDEEGYVGVAAADLFESVGGLAQVTVEVAGAGGLFVQAEQRLQHDLV